MIDHREYARQIGERLAIAAIEKRSPICYVRDLEDGSILFPKADAQAKPLDPVDDTDLPFPEPAPAPALNLIGTVIVTDTLTGMDMTLSVFSPTRADPWIGIGSEVLTQKNASYLQDLLLSALGRPAPVSSSEPPPDTLLQGELPLESIQQTLAAGWIGSIWMTDPNTGNEIFVPVFGPTSADMKIGLGSMKLAREQGWRLVDLLTEAIGIGACLDEK